MIRIGAHVGVGGGWPEAADYAASVGCECIQVFSKSPRTWRASPLDPSTVDAFRDRLDSHGIGPVFVHTAYLINLGSDDHALLERSVEALAVELSRAAVIRAAGLVLHVGTGGDLPEETARERIAASILDSYGRATPGGRRVPLLLENTAGAGTTFGGDLGALGRLVSAVSAGGPPCAVCLDACHAHAYGYPLHTPGDWTAAIHEIATAAGADAVRLVHANDALHARGSHKDRHAWIGEGELGQEAFASMFATPGLEGVCAIIEMPGETPFKDAENISRLKRLRGSSGALGEATLDGDQ